LLPSWRQQGATKLTIRTINQPWTMRSNSKSFHTRMSSTIM
jgi:hypothetical protein